MKRSITYRYGYWTALLVVLILLASLSSCERIKIVIDSEQKRAFLASEKEGYYRNDAAVLLFDEDLHQKSFNKKRKQFRLQSDDQNEFMNIEMEALPKSEGVHILTKFHYKTKGSGLSITLLLECSKLSDEKIWLWDKENKIGLIVPRY